VNLVFLDSALTFNSSVTHLGHILRSDLLDDDDIVAVTRDMCRKANCILYTFSCYDAVVKTNLLRSFCLSLYGCGLWKISSPLVRSLEVAFNNIQRRVWSRPRRCHTCILHQVAGLHSLYNTILDRASKMLHSAVYSPSTLITVYSVRVLI